MVNSGGTMTEWVKYSPYGMAFGLPGCDTDSDGDCDAADITQIDAWIAAPSYDIRGDVDLDGDVDTTDKTIAQTYYQGTTSGWSVLSAQGNRKGYAGYEHDENIGEFLIHVRNRVLHTTLGRWMRRDPLGYVDGMNLFEYVGSQTIYLVDLNGLDKMRPDGTVDNSFGNKIRTCLSDIRVQAALLDAKSSCLLTGYQSSPGGDIKDDPLGVIRCKECKGNYCGLTEFKKGPPPRLNITICTNKECSNKGQFCGILAHELRHAAQACRYGMFKDPWEDFVKKMNNQYNYLCSEMSAYYWDGRCSTVETCCLSVCQGMLPKRWKEPPSCMDCCRNAYKNCCDMQRGFNDCLNKGVDPCTGEIAT